MFISRAKDILPIVLSNKQIGEVLIEGEADLKLMMTGVDLQLVFLDLKAGYFHPKHKHPDNESIGYLISGRIQMMVNLRKFVLEPGDSWHHPKGVYHWTRALEHSTAVEIHSPPRPEFS